MVLSENARQIIDNESVDIPIEVMCEVVFVLFKVYKADRSDIGTQLCDFIDNTARVVPHKEVVIYGLNLFANSSLDFVDCLLVGYKHIENAVVETFDIKLQKAITRDA
jgi:predicted nucleic-acid-binding protein